MPSAIMVTAGPFRQSGRALVVTRDRPGRQLFSPGPVSSTTAIDRDSMARWYATKHLNVDRGIEEFGPSAAV
jgi:hypothetical protein